MNDKMSDFHESQLLIMRHSRNFSGRGAPSYYITLTITVYSYTVIIHISYHYYMRIRFITSTCTYSRVLVFQRAINFYLIIKTITLVEEFLGNSVCKIPHLTPKTRQFIITTLAYTCISSTCSVLDRKSKMSVVYRRVSGGRTDW